MRKFALLALAALLALSAHAQQTITICKSTNPAGGTNFPFTWQNGSGGTPAPFLLNDGQCMTFDVTSLDKFNIFKENVPPGWTLTNISCAFTTSAVSIVGANPNPAFQPGDNTVNIDLNEANVTCKFTNERVVTPVMDVYAVKFVCGDFRPVPPTVPPDGVEYPVKPGNYYTAINLHNPNSIPVSFRKKAVLLYRADKPPAPEAPQPPGKLFDAKLEPDWGFEIDCPDIRNVLLGGIVPAHTFIKGWVILEIRGAVPPPLDVTTVYTSHGWERKGNTWIYQGWAEDVEPTLPKRVQ